MKRLFFLFLLFFLLLGSCTWAVFFRTPPPSTQPIVAPRENPTADINALLPIFGGQTPYAPPAVTLHPSLAADFNLTDVKNLDEIAETYGITLTSSDREFLSKNKFLVKNILATSIRPKKTSPTSREFLDLYERVRGSSDSKERTPSHSVFLTADVFFDSFSALTAATLQELENKELYRSLRVLSANFYLAAKEKIVLASTPDERHMWTAVRNYFAVPYVLLSTVQPPLSQQDYTLDGEPLDPLVVQADFQAKDASVDSLENVTTFLRLLRMDPVSEASVLADLKKILAAKETSAVPVIFQKEYSDYVSQEGVKFSVDFSDFQPRGSYTARSQRRQYFRAMQWYASIPFFIKSNTLTQYAFSIIQLFADSPQDLRDYSKMKTTLGFLTGKSDTLLPEDYIQSLASSNQKTDAATSVLKSLTSSRPLAPFSPSGSPTTSADRLKMSGMRLFSPVERIDDQWMALLTQNDQNRKLSLPTLPSSLEIMGLLGSDEALLNVPTLDTVTPSTSPALNQVTKDIVTQQSKLPVSFWQTSMHSAALWSLSGLFSFERENKNALPAFMKSSMWQKKSLMAASSFWTTLRHGRDIRASDSVLGSTQKSTTACDTRRVPIPSKGYIEPQITAYTRLLYIVRRTEKGLRDAGYTLDNLRALQSLERALTQAIDVSMKELQNMPLQERVVANAVPDPINGTKVCTSYSIAESDWEVLRRSILDALAGAEPIPSNGTLLSATDRRAGQIAHVYDASTNSQNNLYEGTGVPHVILVAVEDENGARVTIGFISSHGEFTAPALDSQLTDDDWQRRFYSGNDSENPYDYVSKPTWPETNSWYSGLVQ